MIGFILILFAGFFQGTWGLGVKRSYPLSWEAFWLPFSLIGMILIPFLWASVAIPDLHRIIQDVPPDILLKPFIFGAVWGIGAVTFGLALKYVGLSLSYGINMGIASSVGALIPFFQLESLEKRLVLVVLTGTLIMLAGVLLITRAGIQREKLQKSGKDAIVQPGITRLGIVLAVIGGLSTAAFNVGFNYGSPIISVAMDKGISAANGSLIVWLFVLSGGFIMNAGYTIYLLIRNRSYRDYQKKGVGKGLLVMLITAVLWFTAIGLYGQGAAVLGKMGPVAGWIMFMALSLIISNLWGIRTGEWKGMRIPVRYLIAGNVLLIISWVLLGFSNMV